MKTLDPTRRILQSLLAEKRDQRASRPKTSFHFEPFSPSRDNSTTRAPAETGEYVLQHAMLFSGVRGSRAEYKILHAGGTTERDGRAISIDVTRPVTGNGSLANLAEIRADERVVHGRQYRPDSAILLRNSWRLSRIFCPHAQGQAGREKQRMHILAQAVRRRTLSGRVRYGHDNESAQPASRPTGQAAPDARVTPALGYLPLQYRSHVP